MTDYVQFVEGIMGLMPCDENGNVTSMPKTLSGIVEGIAVMVVFIDGEPTKVGFNVPEDHPKYGNDSDWVRFIYDVTVCLFSECTSNDACDLSVRMKYRPMCPILLLCGVFDSMS